MIDYKPSMIKYIKNISVAVLALSSFAVNAQTVSGTRQTILFDKSWAFEQSDATGADKITFDDSKWKVLDVPHDWSILGVANQNNPTGRGVVTCLRVLAGTVNIL